MTIRKWLQVDGEAKHSLRFAETAIPTSQRDWVQKLGRISFYVHPHEMGQIAGGSECHILSQGFVPCTILNGPVQCSETLFRTFADFTAYDDVFAGALEHFGTTVILPDTSKIPGSDATVGIKESKLSITYYTTASILPPGPYFLLGDKIHQAWRLYDDELDAFMIATIPDDPQSPERYSSLAATSTNGVWKSIAVPSRLYTRQSSKPLAGARIAVKDCYSVAGIQNTMMSRQYMEIHEAMDTSSDYVKKLIEQGAIIVGKTKINPFAASDEPTDQYTDFHCCFNPRGDMYQSPSGSSAGAAAALAGYSWIDFSIGADTAGSIRAPAACNGLFSLRTSFNSTSMKGIVANCKTFDVVGLLGRDFNAIRNLLSYTHNLETSDRYPKQILYPKEFFPYKNSRHQAMVEEYVTVLEAYLGVKRTEFSLAKRWALYPPAAANGLPLMEYLEKSAFIVQCYHFYHEFEPYRREYRRLYGKEAYAGFNVSYRWDVGERTSLDEVEEHLQRLQVFRDWFHQHVMHATDKLLSNAIMIMPYGEAGPKYRDSPNSTPSGSHSIGEKFLSPILEMPQLVLPIGQMPYYSRVTRRLEYKPIVCTMMGAKGSDHMLLNVAQGAFEKAGWPTEVQTGRYMFDVTNNVRNTAFVKSHLDKENHSNNDDEMNVGIDEI